jgi:twitching motility protein PilT
MDNSATNIHRLLDTVFEKKASDIHLTVGIPPTLRIEGELSPLLHEGVLTQEQMIAYCKEIMQGEQFERFQVNKEVDFSLEVEGKGRFRVNAYTQKGTYGIAARRIPFEIPNPDALGLPPIIHEFTKLKQGFVLVTGPTGHGKSTTLASILEEINMNRGTHIVTIEDPIEFVFSPKKSIITQREMSTDTHSWSIALRSVLREDPDVVLIGEMRDYETIASALTVAETGHLVFATLHTNSAAQTIDRIVDVFPDEQQDQVKLQLSNVLEAVFSQRLIQGVDGNRVVASEVMLATTAIRTAVRDGKTHQIDSIIQTSTDVGMKTLDVSLAGLVREGKISFEVAQSWAQRPEELRRYIAR